VSIYLIRHGETALNRDRVVQPPATPLGEEGIAQAARLAARLADAGIAEIVSSDLERTRMTASPLAQSTGLEIDFDPDLQERNFGDARGTPYAELERRNIALFAPGYAPPGGETWDAFHDRVDRAWRAATARARELETKGVGHLAVVTHGLVCHSILARKVRLSAPVSGSSFGRDGPPIRFGNTALTILSDDDGAWKVELFACTTHLDEATDSSVA
jgi:broad specificity phosphatase PhoE